MVKYKLGEEYTKCIAEPLPEELTTENVDKEKVERARQATAARKAGALSQADIRQERANAIENMTESEHNVFMEERKARNSALKQALEISSLPLAISKAVEIYLDGAETLEWTLEEAGVVTKRPAMEERNRRRTALQARFEGQNIAKFEPLTNAYIMQGEYDETWAVEIIQQAIDRLSQEVVARCETLEQLIRESIPRMINYLRVGR